MKAGELFFRKLYNLVLFLCKLLLIADVVITSVAVAGRYIPFIPDPAWSEEIVLTCMIYMGLLSAALAIRDQTHIRMTMLDRLLPAKVVKILDIFGDAIILIFACFMLAKGMPYAVSVGAKGYYTSLPWLSKFWLYASVPLAGLAIILFELESIYKHIKILMAKEEKRL